MGLDAVNGNLQSADDSSVSETALALSKVNVFIAIAEKSLYEDGKDSVRGHQPPVNKTYF